jgi:hypothetical protein
MFTREKRFCLFDKSKKEKGNAHGWDRDWDLEELGALENHDHFTRTFFVSISRHINVLAASLSTNN